MMILNCVKNFYNMKENITKNKNDEICKDRLYFAENLKP